MKKKPAKKVEQESKPEEQDQDEIKFAKRPPREELTREETLRRMADFPKRKEKMLAADRKAKD